MNIKEEIFTSCQSRNQVMLTQSLSEAMQPKDPVSLELLRK
jgi:hypothetical protein